MFLDGRPTNLRSATTNQEQLDPSIDFGHSPSLSVSNAWSQNSKHKATHKKLQPICRDFIF
jgi:hypothetical protein